uniref:G-protein coupled receptors family 1 profile domain-containing protein n=1 Tax=Acrobeloides nanus TaxID=290746 RepID=A0A914DS98_9BILA
MKNQAHAQKQMSKVQTKIFITVSMALLFYSFFYVIPTMMQMSTYYLGFTANIANIATNIIFYGAEFNGVLNALIYLSTHHEFKECNRRFVYGIIGRNGGSKMEPSKAFTTVKTIKTSNQGCRVS